MIFLLLEPVLKEKLWGGTKLKTLFNYELTSDHVGEAWLISAHKKWSLKSCKWSV